jgi:uncharacterized membrane protein YjdF
MLAAGLVLLALSAIRPHDYFTWRLGVASIFVGVPILVATYASFPLTPLRYRLLFLPAMILMVGGHYTYAEVPLGFWMGACSGSPGTTTTASATSTRASCPRSSPARFSGASW